MLTSTRTRAGLGITVVIAVALALTACSSTKSGSGSGGLAGSSPAPSAAASSAPSSPSAGGGTPTSTATATSTSTGTTHAYPSNYGKAILDAWKAHDTAYLTLLTSASTASTLFGHGDINQTWTGLTPQGAAGSEYWQYYNNAGDWITLQTSNEKTSGHKWHAGSVHDWDKMSFPSDPVVYTKHFIGAWLDGNVARMKLLSSTSLTNTFRAKSSKPGEDFTATGDGAAGHTYVKVKDPSSSFTVTLAVVNMKLGHQSAIESCYAGC